MVTLTLRDLGGSHFFTLLFYISDVSTKNTCFYVMKN